MVENSLVISRSDILEEVVGMEEPTIELVSGITLLVKDEINPCPPNTGFCQPQIMCIPQTEGCMPNNACVPQVTCGPSIGCFPTPPR